MEKPEVNYVIAIGGSLGAVHAVRRLCSTLPADIPAAILLTIHVGSEGQNLLGEIFDNECPLASATAADGDLIRQGRIYVAPADHHLLSIDGSVRLGRGPRENLARPAIDPLFRSVAVDYGPRAIGVVLTGLLDDGAAGLADIKLCKGVTVVQNPTDADARDMPLEALETTDVDHVSSLDRMAALLAQLTRVVPQNAGPIPADLKLEVQMALGRAVGPPEMAEIADPVALSCPTCGGTLSQMHRPPLRFRCQIGHAFSAKTMSAETSNAPEEALLIALRLVEERLLLSAKMADDARRTGRSAALRSIEEKAKDYVRHAAILRASLTKSPS